MVSEGHPTVFKTAGPGLGDVVEQGGEPNGDLGFGLGHHGNGVAEDVLVSVDGVLFHAQGQ